MNALEAGIRAVTAWGREHPRLRPVWDWFGAHPLAAAIAPVVVYKAMLDFSYAAVVPGAKYYALFAPQLNLVKLLESYLLLAAVLAITPRTYSRLSTVFLWLVLLISFVPMLTIYAFRDESRLFTYATAAFWVEVALILRYAPTVRLPRPSAELARRAWIGLYALVIGVSIVVLVVWGSPLLAADWVREVADPFKGVYGARSIFVAAGLPLKGYYFHWLALIFNPVFFAFALLRRNWLLLVAIVLLQFLIGTFVGLRSYFLTLGLILGIVVVLNWRQVPAALGLGLTSVVAGGAAVELLLGKALIHNLLTARFLLVPAQISYLYYEFFTRLGITPLLYVLKFLYIPYGHGYQFGVDPDLVIGAWYWGERDVAAVAGIVPDAYMELGWIGMAVFAAALGVILKVADSCAEGVDIRLATAALVMPAVALPETYFIRVLLTTGMLWALVVLYLLPRPQRVAEQTRVREPLTLRGKTAPSH